MYPFITIFGRTVGTYGIASVVGFLIAGFVVSRASKARKIQYEDIILLFLSAGAGLLVGGHLLYGLTHLPEMLDTFSSLANRQFKETLMRLGIIFGGMVFYGGLLGSMAGIAVHTHFSKTIERSMAFDILAVAAPLFHTFGRIGCFFGGCCYGIECEWGFTVYNNTLSPGINGVPRFPVQLLEAALNFALFILVYNMFKKDRQRGRLIFVYLPCYAVIRLCTEMLRGDSIRGFVGIFSTSQFISILILAVCAVRGVIILRRKKYKEV